VKGNRGAAVGQPTGPVVLVGSAADFRELEDHVWFEDRWMVASLCDE
jgi:hypothetical protein